MRLLADEVLASALAWWLPARGSALARAGPLLLVLPPLAAAALLGRCVRARKLPADDVAAWPWCHASARAITASAVCPSAPPDGAPGAGTGVPALPGRLPAEDLLEAGAAPAAACDGYIRYLVNTGAGLRPVCAGAGAAVGTPALVPRIISLGALLLASDPPCRVNENVVSWNLPRTSALLAVRLAPCDWPVLPLDDAPDKRQRVPAWPVPESGWTYAGARLSLPCRCEAEAARAWLALPAVFAAAARALAAARVPNANGLNMPENAPSALGAA